MSETIADIERRRQRLLNDLEQYRITCGTPVLIWLAGLSFKFTSWLMDRRIRMRQINPEVFK